MNKLVIFGALFFAPAVTFAQGELDNVFSLVNSIRDVVDVLIPLVAALALLYFFWGLAKFILNSDNEEARDSGKHIMIWGVVALFIIVSVWGLVAFIGDAIGIPQDGGNQPIPGIGN